MFKKTLKARLITNFNPCINKLEQYYLNEHTPFTMNTNGPPKSQYYSDNNNKVPEQSFLASMKNEEEDLLFIQKREAGPTLA